MTYLKRNINLLLLIVTVLLIGYTLTLTTYYQTTFEKVTLRYYDQVSEYERLIADFQERERLLNETSFELTRKTQSTEKLGELYTDVVSEKDQLEADLQAAKTQLESAKETVKIKEAEIAGLVQDVESYEELADSISSEIGDVMDDLNDDSNLSSSDLDELFEDLNGLAEDLLAVS